MIKILLSLPNTPEVRAQIKAILGRVNLPGVEHTIVELEFSRHADIDELISILSSMAPELLTTKLSA